MGQQLLFVFVEHKKQEWDQIFVLLQMQVPAPTTRLKKKDAPAYLFMKQI